MEEKKCYDYSWLFEILIQIRTARKIVPSFSIDDNYNGDPGDIIKLKNALFDSKCQLYKVEGLINKLMENRIGKKGND